MDGLEHTADEGTCFDEPPSPSAATSKRDPSPGEPGAERWTRIARTIENEVIPRLMLSHRLHADFSPEIADAAAFSERTPEVLANLALGSHDDQALAFVHALLADGLPMESIFLDLLAPAARILGKRWEEDVITFTDVTIALTKLQRLMRRLAAVSRPFGALVDKGSILLAPVPGEQHLFGVLMLEEFFRRDGWHVDVLPGPSREEILSTIEQGQYRAVGISVSADDHLDVLKSLVADIRRRLEGRSPLVMVGGRCFKEDPELFRAMGADFTAVDGKEAIGHIQFHLLDDR